MIPYDLLYEVKVILTVFTHSFFFSDFAKEKDSFPVMYPIVNRYLREGYSVVYCVEPGPLSRVIKNMHRAGIDDVETLIEDGLLHIVDRQDVYSHLKELKEKRNFPRQKAEEQVFKKFRKMIDECRSKSPRRRMIYFGYPAVYYEDNDYEPFLIHENAIDKFRQHPRTLQWVCCSGNHALDQMPLWQELSMLNLHDKIFHEDGDSDTWHSSYTLDLLEEGIEKALGGGAAHLLISTLKLVYGIDGQMIIENPAKFESATTKVLGEAASSIVIKKIKNEIKNRLTLEGGHSGYDNIPNGVASKKRKG
jgi:hypothetical protein